MRALLAVLATVSTAASPAGGTSEPEEPRFRIESARVARSADPAARFAIDSRATRRPAPAAGARFTLLASPKATDGTCGPDADALFAHGFE